MKNSREDVLALAATWLAQGRTPVLATVVRTWGSSPRAVGSHLVIARDGAFMGSVSGGCIEGAVVIEAESVFTSGNPKLLEYGVSDERAWEVGLTCGGTIEVFLEPFLEGGIWPLLAKTRERREPVARVVHLDSGLACLARGLSLEGPLTLPPGRVSEIAEMVTSGKSGTLEEPAGIIFVHAYPPPVHLLLVGAVHIAQPLASMANLVGFEVTVIDPRRAFASLERFPDITLIDGWPNKDLFAPDAGTAVVTLSHDPKIDDPALILALESDAFYVGALGSRKTHAKRLARLGERFPQEVLARIHGPVGLDLGGRAAPQVAVSILAHIIQVRCKGA